MNRDVRRLIVYFLYLFSAWSIFRFFVHMPEIIEEIWFKVVIWLVPLFWWFLSIDRKPKLFGGNLFRSLMVGLLCGGVMFGFFVWMRGGLGEVTWERVLIKLLISSVEQITFAGLVLPLLIEKSKLSSGWCCLIVGLMYGLIHLPIGWLVYRLDLMTLGGVFLINVLLSSVANSLRLGTKNILPSVILEWSVLVGAS